MMSCGTLAAIGLHLASWHSSATYNEGTETFSNVNPGVFVRMECGLTVGAYRNSQRNLTAYAAYTVDPPALPVWASVGVGTGYGKYPDRPRPLTPLVIAGIKSRPIAGYRMRLGYIPRLGETNEAHVLHFMIEKGF